MKRTLKSRSTSIQPSALYNGLGMLLFCALLTACTEPVGTASAPSSAAGSSTNEYMLGEVGGSTLVQTTQGLTDSVGLFGGSLGISVGAYRVGHHTGRLTYLSADERASIGALRAERNGLPFQWHRPWFARFTLSNATRNYYGQMGTAPIPQSGFIEYADGSRERLYAPQDGATVAWTSRFGTWQRIANGSGLEVTSRDGTRIRFENGPCFGTANMRAGLCEATSIEDRTGTGLAITYYGQSDQSLDNDSLVPRIVETYRRGANAVVPTGRAFFYVGSNDPGGTPTSPPSDIFDLPSVSTGRIPHNYFNQLPRPTWTTDLDAYVHAIAYAGPNSPPLVQDASWHVTRLNYRTTTHGFVNGSGQASAPYFDWTQLESISTEGEVYAFHYGYLSSWPTQSAGAEAAMGRLHRAVLPRLGTEIEYAWDFGASGFDATGAQLPTGHFNELSRRTLRTQLQDGTTETHVWNFLHQDVVLSENGNSNRYRAAVTSYPTGSSSAHLFYPLAPDGTVAAARTGQLSEIRTYATTLLQTNPQLSSTNVMSATLAQSTAVQTQRMGYATYAIGRVLVESPASEDWADWQASLSPPVHTSGHWHNSDFVGWISLPAWDATTVQEGQTNDGSCCMTGQFQGQEFYCQSTDGASPTMACPDALYPAQSHSECTEVGAPICEPASLNGFNYFCSGFAPANSPVECPSGTLDQASCQSLGPCNASPTPASEQQTIVRMYRENSQHRTLEPFATHDAQFNQTWQDRTDYDFFGNRPFERVFATSGPVTIGRTPTSCRSTCRHFNGPTYFGFRCGVPTSNGIDTSTWDCTQDTIAAPLPSNPNLGSETRFRYLVEESEHYAKPNSLDWLAFVSSDFPNGVLNLVTERRVCQVGTTCTDSDGLRSQINYDFDNRTVPYPFSDAPGDGSTAATGRLTYQRQHRIDAPEESLEQHFRYYGDGDVALEPNGRIAEIAIRTSATTYRRSRVSYHNPEAAAFRLSESPMRSWILRPTDGGWVPELVGTARFNTWDLPVAELSENLHAIYNCYDDLGRLTAQHDSDVAQSPVCPQGDEDVPLASSRTWYDNAANSVRTRRRVFYDGNVIASDSFAFLDGLGRIIQRRSLRHTDGGVRTNIVSTDYHAHTSEVQRQSVPVSSTAALDQFTDYGFSSGRVETTFDVLGRPAGSRTYNNQGSLVAEASIRRGDIDPQLALNVVESTDAQGQVRRIELDPMGRTLESRLPDGSTIGYEYNSQGQLTGVRHPDGLVSTTVYDGLGRIAEQSSPEAGVRHFGYNRVSELVQTVNANGTAIHFTMDHRGRLRTRESHSGSAVTTLASIRYDVTAGGAPVSAGYALGRPTRAVSESGTVHYAYDRRGNIVQSVVTLHGLEPKHILRRFDTAGALREESYQSGAPDAFTTRIELNANGEFDSLLRVTETTETLSHSVYDDLGRLAYRDVLPSYPDGYQQENFVHDEFGRLLQVNDPTALGSDVFAYRLGFEAPQIGSPRRDGRPSEVEWNTAHVGAGAYVYGYNPRGEVTSADFRRRSGSSWLNPTTYDFAAQYDAAGSPISTSLGSVTGTDITSYAYETTTRRLTATSGAFGTSLAYNAAGQVTDNSVWGGANSSLTYTETDRPRSVANGQVRYSFAYDFAQEQVRIERAEWRSPCAADEHQMGGGGLMRGGLGGNPNATRGDIQPLGCYQPASVSHIVRAPSGEPIAEYIDGALARVHVAGLGTYVPPNNPEAMPAGYYTAFRDHLGSVRAVIHQDGFVTQAVDYGVFGAPLPGRTFEQTGASHGTFASYREIDALGAPFSLAGARLYFPAIGRFLSPDPLQASDAINNGYNYAQNAPNTLTDPSGLSPWPGLMSWLFGTPANGGVLAGVTVTAPNGQLPMQPRTLGPVQSMAPRQLNLNQFRVGGGAAAATNSSLLSQAWSSTVSSFQATGRAFVAGAHAFDRGVDAGVTGFAAGWNTFRHVWGDQAHDAITDRAVTAARDPGVQALVLFLLPAAIPEAVGGRVSFFTVQSADDAARLRAGGGPWPTGLERANMGQGFYAWGNRAQAEAYLQLLEGKGASGLRILEGSIDARAYSSLRTLDMRVWSDDAVNAWMDVYSHYGRAQPHTFQHVMRNTSNIGAEFYFSTDAFGLFTIR